MVQIFQLNGNRGSQHRLQQVVKRYVASVQMSRNSSGRFHATVSNRLRPRLGFGARLLPLLIALFLVSPASGQSEPPYSLELSTTEINASDLSSGVQVTLTPKNASFIGANEPAHALDGVTLNGKTKFYKDYEPNENFIELIELINAPSGLTITDASINPRRLNQYDEHNGSRNTTDYRRTLTITLGLTGLPLSNDVKITIAVAENLLQFIAANGILNDPGKSTDTSGILSASLLIKGDSTAGALVYTGAPVDLEEGGGSKSYHIRLARDPGMGKTVTVTPSSSDSASATVATTLLSFTGGPAGTWQYPQSVQVTPVNDDDARDEAVFISHTVTGLPDGTTTGRVTVTVSDDESVGFEFNKTSLSFSSTASYTIKLTSKPSSDVIVNIETGRQGVVFFGSSTSHQLTFKPADYSTAQSVSLNGGVQGSTTIVHKVESLDVDYDRLAAPAVGATYLLSGSPPGITITPSKGITVQPNRSASYDVSLDTQPTAQVTVTGTIANTEHATPSGATSSTFTVTFNSGQTGPKTVTIDHGGTDGITRITHTASSTDTFYDNILVPDIAVSANPASDPPYSLQISPNRINTNSNTAVNLVPVNATVNSFSSPNVKLLKPPAGFGISSTNVVASPNRTIGEGAAKIQHHSLQVFFNYTGAPLASDTPVKIQIDKSILRFLDQDGNVLNVGAATSTSSSLSATLTLIGNPAASPLTFGGVPIALEEEGEDTTDTYTVRLKRDPGNRTVTVMPSSSDTKVATVPATPLRFTGGSSGNWQTPQSIQVTAVADDDARDNLAYISHAITGWPGVTRGGQITVSVTDSATPGLHLSTNEVVIYDGESARYSYRLDSKPSDPVTITATIADNRFAQNKNVKDEEGNRVSHLRYSETFTKKNWDTPRYVDLETGGATTGSTTISHTVVSDDPDYDSMVLGDLTVTLEPQPAESRALLSVSGTAIDEGSNLIVSVELKGGSPPSVGKTFPLVYTNDSAEAADYTKANSVQVVAGQRKGTATVPIVDDNLYERTAETFNVKLGTLPPNIRAALPQEQTSADISINPSDTPELSISGGGDVTEGTAAQFTITASNPSDADLTINVTSNQVGAYADPGDLGAAEVTLSAGSTSVIYEIDTTARATDEADGGLTTAFQSSDNYTIKSGEGLARVAIRDSQPTVATMSVAAASIGETGGSTTITVSLNRELIEGESLSLPFTVEGTAELGKDYSLTPPDTLPTGITPTNLGSAPTVTFTGPSANNIVLTLSSIGDVLDEGSGESVAIGLPSLGVSSGTGLSGGAEASGDASLTINDDDDPPVVKITGPTAALIEGDTATFSIDVTGISQANLTIGLDITVAGGQGLVASAATGTKEVSLPSGTESLTYEVRTLADDIDEPSGMLTVRVNTGTGYTVASSSAASVSIMDDDATGVTLSTPAGDISETSGTKVITITLDRGLVTEESLSLPLKIGGTATFGTDYTLSAPNTLPTGVTYTNLSASNPRTHRPTVTFTGPSTGQTSSSATFTVSVSSDNLDEGDGETISIDLPSLGSDSGTGLDAGAVSAGTVAFTITDDDSAPEISLAMTSNATLIEGSEGKFTLTANNPSANDLTINLNVTQVGSFVASNDAGSQQVRLPAGDTSATWVLPTDADTTDEATGSVSVALATGDGYTRSSTQRGESFNVSDDDATLVTLTVPAGDISETNGTKTLTITLGRALKTGESLPVTLSMGGSATIVTDYTLSAPNSTPTGVAYTMLGETPTITFTGGDSASATATLILNATGDTVNEGASESVSVALAALHVGSGVGLAGGATGSGSGSFAITDDDADPEISISGGSNIKEGGDAVFTVTANTVSSSSVTVNLSVTEQGSFATSGGTGSSKSVVIPAGSSSVKYKVATQSDGADEPSGSITVTASAGAGYTISSGSGSASVNVADVDASSVTISDSNDVRTVEGNTSDPASIQVTVGRTLESGEVLVVPLIITTDLDSSEYSLSLSPTQGVGLNGNTLTFTGGSGAARTANVNLVATADDNLVTDSVVFTIPTSSIIGDPKLTATNLNGGAVGNGTARIIVSDAGASAGVTLSETQLTLAEGGEGRYSIVLDSDPGSGVTVRITPDPGVNSGLTVQPSSVSFTGGASGNWNTPQFITVSVAADKDKTDETATISHRLTGYAGVSSVSSVNVSITDASVGFVVEPTTVVVTAGSTATYKIKTLSEPSARITFTLASDATGIATVSEDEQKFNTKAWSRGKSITVTGVAAGTATITHTTTSTTVADYGSLTPESVTVVVQAADAPQVSISADSEVTEGNSIIFEVSIPSALSSDLVVNYDNVDVGGFDIGSLTGSVTIPAGDTSANITVSFTDDSTDTRNGSLTVTLAPSQNYSLGNRNNSATVKLIDASATGVTLAGSGNIAETGGEGELTLTLGRKLEAGEVLPVALNLTGTASLGTDYTLNVPAQVPAGISYSGLNTTSPTITFTGSSVSSSVAKLRIVAITDSVVEGAETISFALPALDATSGTELGGGASGSGSASFTLVDDDITRPEISISGGAAVTEGSSATFTVSATGSATVSVKVNINEMGEFIGANTGEATIPEFNGSTISSIQTNGDSNDEADGKVRMTVVPDSAYTISPTAGTAEVTVRDNDATSITLSAPTGRLAENGGKREITVTLGRALASGESLTVPLTFTGTATLGSDYSLSEPNPSPSGVTYSGLSSTPNIIFTGGAGSSATATLILTGTADEVAESDETVSIAIGTVSATGLNGGTNTSGTPSFTIADNFDPMLPTAQITVISTSNEKAEGGTHEFRIVVSPRPSSNLPVSLTVNQKGDFFDSSTKLGPKTVTVPASSGTLIYQVQSDNDSKDEPKGSLTVSIAAGAGYVVHATQGVASATVLDDDPTSVALSSAANGGDIDETGGSQSVTVTLGRALVSGEVLPVPLEFTGGAAFGADYTLTIPGSVHSSISYSNLTSTDHSANPPTITFTGGSGSTTKASLTLTAAHDILDEGSGEQVNVGLKGLNTTSGTNLHGGASPSGTAGFTIADDDDTPIIRVVGGADITEGSNAVFTLHADPAPQGELDVSLNVTQQLGNFVASGDLGTQTATISANAKSGTFNVTTDNSGTDVDEPSGTVTVTVVNGNGYAPSSSRPSDTVKVADNDSTVVTLSTPDTTATEKDSSAKAQIRIDIGRTLVAGEKLSAALTFSGATLGTEFSLSGSSSQGIVTDNAAATVTFTGPTTLSYATFDLVAKDDADEVDETVTVSLGTITATGLAGGASSTRTGVGQIAITDAGPQPAVDVSMATIAVTEKGMATYRVKLHTDPGSGTVTVTPKSGDTDLLTVSGPLSFTTSNWSEWQTVTIEALRDTNIVEDRVTITHRVSGYGSVTAGPEVDATIPDAGHAVTVSASSVTISEKASTTYQVVLDSKPKSKVTITPSSSRKGIATVGDAVFFEQDNWNMRQSITVSGVSSGTALISHKISTSDGNYSSATAASVSVIVTPIAKVITSLNSLTVRERGSAGTYTVRLATNPGGTVAVTPSEHIPSGVFTREAKLALSHESLSFNENNWSIPQTISVKALGDSDIGNDTVRIDHAVSGYAGVTKAPKVNVTVLDAGAGFLVEPTSLSMIASDEATYDVTLLSQPVRPVTITATSDVVGTVGFKTNTPGTTSNTSAITFAVADAGKTKTFSVVAGSTVGSATISHTVTTDDIDYRVSVDSVRVTVTSADSVSVVPTSLSLIEGGSNGTYKVKLNSDPGGTVTITPSSDDTAAVTVTGGPLTFTSGNAGNWDEEQTLTVSTVEDSDMSNESVTISHTISGYPNVSTVPDVSVSVRDKDIIPTVEFTTAFGGVEGQAGSTVSFNLSVDPAPISALTVDINLVADGNFFAADALGDKTVTFAKDATTAVYVLPIVDDAVDDGLGTATAKLVANTAYTIGTKSFLQQRIDDNDQTVVKLTVPEGNIDETGGSKTLTVSLGRPLKTISTPDNLVIAKENVRVGLKFTGAAVYGTDFNLVAPDPVPAGVTYALDRAIPSISFVGPSVSSATVTLNALSDTIDEGASEAVSVSLDRPVSAYLLELVSTSGTGAFQIIDDDGEDTVPIVSVTAGADVEEGTAASFTVKVSPVQESDLDVSLTVSQTGSFVASTNIGTDKSVTITGGSASATFTVATVNNTGAGSDEADGKVTVAINSDTDYTISSSAGTASVGVTDNDATSVVLSLPDATATENDPNNTATIRISLNRALVTGESLNVPLVFSGGTAGTDFTLTLTAATGLSFNSSTSVVTFTGQAGAAKTADLTFSASADADTANETVTVNLQSPFLATNATGLNGGVSGSRTGNGQIVVTDIGVARTLGWSSTVVTVAETTTGGSASGTATLSSGSGPVTFRVCLADVTAIRPSDYPGFVGGNACTGTDTTNTDFEISSGQSSLAVTLALAADTTDEPSETFTATLSLPTAVPALSINQAASVLTIRVTDNDPTQVTLSGPSGNLAEGSTKTIRLALGRALTGSESLTVPLIFGTASGHATRGTDYSLSCPSPLPTGVTCSNLNSGSASVTFSAGGSAVDLTLSALTDGVAETTAETVEIGLGTLDANSGVNLDGGASGTDSLADFTISDGAAQPSITIRAASTNAIAEGNGARFILTATPRPNRTSALM